MTNNLDRLSDLEQMAGQCAWLRGKMAEAWAKMFVEDHPGMDVELIRKWFAIVMFIGYTAGEMDTRARDANR